MGLGFEFQRFEISEKHWDLRFAHDWCSRVILMIVYHKFIIKATLFST